MAKNDKKQLQRINKLIKDIVRAPVEGVVKPESLKGNLSGWLSRRIDGKNRIVYSLLETVSGEERLEIIACRYHY